MANDMVNLLIPVCYFLEIFFGDDPTDRGTCNDIRKVNTELVSHHIFLPPIQFKTEAFVSTKCLQIFEKP